MRGSWLERTVGSVFFCIEVIVEGQKTLLNDDDVRFGKLFIVIVLLLRSFGVLLLPQVEVDLGDR